MQRSIVIVVEIDVVAFDTIVIDADPDTRAAIFVPDAGDVADTGQMPLIDILRIGRDGRHGSRS